MKKFLSICLFHLLGTSLSAQLTIEGIMADPKISVGALPSNPYWSEDSRTIYFSWNPESKKADSLYAAMLTDKQPLRVMPAQRLSLPVPGDYNQTRTQMVYAKNGDLFLLDLGTMVIRTLTNTLEAENNPSFANDDEIVFYRGDNVFTVNLITGLLTQRSNFQSGTAKSEPKRSEQEKQLRQEQLDLFEVLQQRVDKKKEGEQNAKTDRPKRPKAIFLDDKRVEYAVLSPDKQYLIYQLSLPATSERNTVVPNYITESGFTEEISARSKVGGAQEHYELWIYDVQRDTVIEVSTKNIAGIYDPPDYLRDYAMPTDTAKGKKPTPRSVYFNRPFWSENGRYCVLVLNSADNKDRWIMQLDPVQVALTTVDRQRDEAWIGGPINALGFLGDDQTLYYQSEASGYAHLYIVDLATQQKTQLTSGSFEVQKVTLSRDKQWFYLITNEVHPGEQQLYKMSVRGGARTRLTQQSGAYQVAVSPDERQLAYLYSAANQPWELFVQENDPLAKPVQITHSQSAQFKAYPWRQPQIITFRARDGQPVYARLYTSAGKKGKKPAVIFVHGAGYLQNAHRWWSYYFREYMFHNFLADQGYTVLDMDYRGSAGYGRDWRTGIYRHMGGQDLNDEIDGARWLVTNQGVDPQRIGIYGGSYGGFMTLMAMFTQPGVFKAGAALRSVTDWAAYNQGYTANILNEPQTDSLAYRRSSPIYYADGLQGHLLLCHGMLDVNVHFQDIVRLTQRLIELKKDHWELAAYPLEDHAFVEPSSWTDEYKRIFRLFEETLK